MSIEAGVRRFVLSTTNWGDIKILRPLPKGEDPWGVLASLKDTAFESLIPVVSGEDMSQALYGRADPLVRTLGREPAACLRLIPQQHRICSEIKKCIMADPKVCHPTKKVPACYRPGGMKNPGSEEVMAAALVTLTWAEGRYVVVVEGDEFTF